MVSNAYQQYQHNSIMTANREELTLMLYNGAIKFCNQAIEAIEKKDMQKAHNCNIKAQNIITELQVTLDSKFQYAEDINKLYDFIRQLLIEGNISKDTKKIEDALNLIRQFRDLWQQVMQQVRKGR